MKTARHLNRTPRRADRRIADGACMDELTLGLIGAGAVVVGGVVVYNAWQGAKVRRKMPRPMPAVTAQSFGRNNKGEQSPFIDPAGPPPRREPVVGSEQAAETSAARVEPTFGAT